jgi:hypothetical protein
MADQSLGYVVVTFNQASHQPGLNPGADLYSQLEDAVSARDWERAETAKVGRGETHVIAEVFEVDEDEIPQALEGERARWQKLAARAGTSDG